MNVLRMLRIVWILGVAVLVGLAVFPENHVSEKVVASHAPAEMKINQQMIALTFDDGPSAETTARLLDGLRDRGAKATFFLMGKRIPANAELVQRIQAEGHQVGNHTWNHTKLQGQPKAVVMEEVLKTDEELKKVLGDGVYWVRPPFGLIDQDQKSLIPVPLVKWSIDPWDWKVKNVDKDVDAVLKDAKPGGIILMHDTVPESVDAALRIIDTLQAQGYRFVTVKELLEQSGVTVRPGVMYYSAIKSV